MAKQLTDRFREVLGVPNNYLDEDTHFKPYRDLHFYQDHTGYIVWRGGSGNNTELLHLNSSSHRRGYGRELVRRMLVQLRDTTPPYHSVFGFTRSNNDEAIAFYQSVGFQVTLVENVYRSGAAVMFHQEFFKLLEHNNVD